MLKASANQLVTLGVLDVHRNPEESGQPNREPHFADEIYDLEHVLPFTLSKDSSTQSSKGGYRLE